MGDIKFGVSFHDTYEYDLGEVVRYAQMVEELGFDSLWITENVNSGRPALEPLVALGVFAAYTKRVTIGPAVILLPLRNPVALAHTAATLDRISGGRLVLAVGAGNPNRQYFRAYGVSTTERGRRCDEYLPIILRLLEGGPVTYSGRFYHLSGYVLPAKPKQLPHPPIWVGGDADGVLKRTATWGDGSLPHSIGPGEYARLLDRLERYADEAGRDTSKIVKAAQLYFCMAKSRGEAKANAEKVLSRRYGRRFTLPDDDENRCAFGTADDCLRAIEKYVEAGARHFVFSTALPKALIPGQVERLATEIVPRFV